MIKKQEIFTGRWNLLDGIVNDRVLECGAGHRYINTDRQSQAEIFRSKALPFI